MRASAGRANFLEMAILMNKAACTYRCVHRYLPMMAAKSDLHSPKLTLSSDPCTSLSVHLSSASHLVIIGLVHVVQPGLVGKDGVLLKARHLPIDRQTNMPTGVPQESVMRTGRQAGGQAGMQVGRQTGRQTDRRTSVTRSVAAKRCSRSTIVATDQLRLSPKARVEAQRVSCSCGTIRGSSTTAPFSLLHAPRESMKPCIPLRWPDAVRSTAAMIKPLV
jgi:hypothetical protein